MGTTVLAGWFTGVQWLKAASPGLASIKFNTGAAFVAAAASLALSGAREPSHAHRAAATATALAVTLTGGLTLAEYVLGTDLGIDEFVIADDDPRDWTLYPGRMAPATAVGLLLVGSALVLLRSARQAAGRVRRALVLVVLLASLIAVVGFLYGIRSPYSVRPFFWMPLPTAATFVALCIGVLSVRPDFPPQDHDLGGTLAGRLVPLVVLVPVVLGWLHLVGKSQDFYNFEFGLASYTATTVLFFSLLLWWAHHALKEADQRRTRAERQAREHEAALAHALRLSTIGEIAASLAHELNQPLSAIRNYARGTIRRASGGGHDAGELLEITGLIADESERASRIIQRLNLHAKKWEPQRGMVDLNAVTRHATEIVASQAQAKCVAVSVNLASHLPEVVGDAIQLEQVIVNLLLNGIDALEKRDLARSLVVETRANVASVDVVVADNGCGVPKENIDRIFEPFFTTKPAGLGMGLAISRSLVEAHAGRLSLVTNPQGGSTFRLTLPASKERHHDE